MPIRTERVKPLTLRDLKKSRTINSTERKPKIGSEWLKEMELNYFGIPNKNSLGHDSANNITNNVKINRFNEFVFNAIDRLNPFLQKHPKVADKLVKFCEKLLKFENLFSKGIQ